MIGEQLIIGFKQDKAYLTPEKPLSFAQLSWSSTIDSFEADAFWTIEVLDFDPLQMKL